MAQSDFDIVFIGGTQYMVPKAGANPPYGEQLNAYLKALGAAYATLVGVGDLPETAAPILNNQTSAVVVEGLSFDSTQIRSASVDYQITRTVTGNNLEETGSILMLYNPLSSAGSQWTYIREAQGNSFVDFTINDAGEVMYVSSNFVGTSYTGIIKFKARAILQS